MASSKLTPEQHDDAKRRREVAMHLHAIEGSPVTPEQDALFAMMEREGWSHERRRALIGRDGVTALDLDPVSVT